MKPAQDLLNEHINRLSTAVALEKPDRVPVVLGIDAFCAQHMGVTIADLVNDLDRSNELMLQSMQDLGDVDGTMLTVITAHVVGPAFLCNVKLPGRELGVNDLWQVDEVAAMTLEDYDTIINKGWNYFFNNFLQNRIPKAWGDFQHFFKSDFKKFEMKFVNAGILPFCSATATPPYDYFCFGRGLTNFTKDIFRHKDKVIAAADAAMVDILQNLRQQIRAAKPFSVFVGAPRSAGELVSPKMWNTFVWPYLKRIVETVVEEGSIAYLHLDGNWERDLAKFRELPKAKCIWGSDHATDIFKVKEVLGDHMCVFGDVPAALLTLGTPDEVYNYSTKLINEIGPAGFILAQACYMPANAKVENVKALVAAANGK
ncbi:uroporphyrinogen decarboxylase family protein [Sporomusa acidovorans]|uniref:Uroporphyrinogen decarboxylase (URO-D) domain-containing protein n=1 Tax=Sporomusa acidovorans (strain ATCC 49682 / DSM 3132 / Mol) TaxID=1123286 RepID=A0ABZ3JAF7_SPOA4|nr:uroporphyrinogen decarboxylase family protein [Sporomusa acidovorans]OZC21849.1 methylcobalamin:coenzyme M methyltransferase [Sporomusa acidovorans DSM 3132]SDD54916.1 Uroporphyrinogen decarboxylase (URO-D) [Sporomusa acidovorans]